MRIRTIFFTFLIALACAVPVEVFAQQDDDVRGAFLTTRPKASDKGEKTTGNAKPSRRRPKAAPDSPGPNNSKPKGGSTPAPGKATAQRLGLGLTLFRRDANGLAVRTDPSHDFRKGDRVRVLLETNADGYIYIFNTTDDGKPVMIYPDPEVDEAGNYIQSHVPFEIPSSLAAEERLRWFSFDQNAGTEKLYFVFTREPLATVPIEDDLITFCRDNASSCPWHPATDVWARIRKEAGEPVKIAQAGSLGTAQTSVEHRAATRGIGLNRDDPEPSLIMLTASTSRNMLVTTLELSHKAVSLLLESNPEEPQ